MATFLSQRKCSNKMELNVVLPFSATVSGPPLSPWQESVPLAQAQSRLKRLHILFVVFRCNTDVVEEESPKKSLHFLSEVLRMLTMVSFRPHCPGCLTGLRGVYALVPPHPDIVEALPKRSDGLPFQKKSARAS